VPIWREADRIVAFHNKPTDLVLVGFDHRASGDFVERHVGQRAFRGHSTPLGIGREAGQLIARLHLVGVGQQHLEIGESIAFSADRVRISHVCSLEVLPEPRDAI